MKEGNPKIEANATIQTYCSSLFFERESSKDCNLWKSLIDRQCAKLLSIFVTHLLVFSLIYNTANLYCMRQG